MCTVCVCQQLSYRYLLGNLVGCCQCACLLQLCPELAGPAISAWTEGEFQLLLYSTRGSEMHHHKTVVLNS